MSKYLITFVLLAFLALENNHIFNRLHAKSYPSGPTINTVTHFMRQHQYRHRTAHTHNKHYSIFDQHQAHHARKHIKQYQKQNFGKSQKEDEAEQNSRRDIERIKRHMEQQRQHRSEHDQRLQQRSQRPVYSAETLKTMPRIWQHLSMVYDYDYEDYNDRMYGDSPVEEIVLETDESNVKVEIPLTAEEDDVQSSENQEESISSNNNKDKNEEDHNHNNTNAARCPKCENNRQVEHVTEEELTRLRIEFVKQQILEKLRLKERPNVSAVGLPKPIYEGVTIEQEEDSTVNKDLDDYYARTSKKFIFLEVGKFNCGLLLYFFFLLLIISVCSFG